MDEYEPDEYELNGPVPRSVPWFGTASMVFGVLAFGGAFLSYQVGSAVATQHFKVGRGDDGSFARTLYLIAIVMTVSSAFGSVVSVFIAVLRGEESLWLLLPGMLWLSLLLLCGLLILLYVMYPLGMNAIKDISWSWNWGWKCGGG